MYLANKRSRPAADHPHLQISVEFHDHIDGGAVPKIREIISRLKEAGFIYFPFSFFTYNDVLFVNSNFIKLTGFEIFVIKVIKYQRGILRMAKRYLNEL